MPSDELSSETRTQRGLLWWLDKAAGIAIMAVVWSLGGYALEQEFGLFKGYGALLAFSGVLAYWWLNVARPVMFDA